MQGLLTRRLGFGLVAALTTAALAAPVCRAGSILADEGRVGLAYLGITLAPPTNAAPANGASGLSGLTVRDVDPSGPAAGQVETGDLLRSVNSQMLFNVPQFDALLATLRPGEPVDLHLYRGGQGRTVSIPLDERFPPAADLLAGAPDATDATNEEGGRAAALASQPHRGEPVDVLIDRIRGAFEQTIPEAALNGAQTEQFMEEVRRQIVESTSPPPPEDPNSYRIVKSPADQPPSGANRSTVRTEEAASLSVELVNGVRTYTYRDEKGNLQQGSMESSDDRRNMPIEAWKMLYRMEREGQAP